MSYLLFTRFLPCHKKNPLQTGVTCEPDLEYRDKKIVFVNYCFMGHKCRKLLPGTNYRIVFIPSFFACL
jgi:hypothetical protein